MRVDSSLEHKDDSNKDKNTPFIMNVYFSFLQLMTLYILKKYNCMQNEVDIKAVIGFSGKLFHNSGNTSDGLLLHPDNEHIVYSLGSTVVIRHILSRTQTFLRGHDSKISCINLLLS